MIDNYSHGDIGVIYISENIPGPSEQSLEGEELLNKFNSQLMRSCKCNEQCFAHTCECLQISGGANYTLNNLGNFLINKRNIVSSTSFPIVECNELCLCSDYCGNRLVQKGPLRTLYVKSLQNELKGLGLFTSKLIPKGSFVCEYAGEILTKEQAICRHRYNEQHKKMNYIFCLNEHGAQKTVQTFIDPSEFGNVGRYINHSCDPNCEIVPVRVSCPIPKLAVFSVSDIQPDTEITFDYGSDDLNSVSDNTSRKPCLCNSSKCKGFMPYFPY